jgi:hypothetical protein
MKRVPIYLLLLYSSVALAQLTDDQIRKINLVYTERNLDILSTRLIRAGYLSNAELIVDRLLELNPESKHYNFRKGYVLMESRMDYLHAIYYLNKASTQINPKYTLYKPNQKGGSPTTYYYLGWCYHLNQELDLARKNYRAYIQLNTKDSLMTKKAVLKLAQCDVAENLLNTPSIFEVKNVGSQINSIYPEYAPSISLDGSTLYFTSRRPWGNNGSKSLLDPRTNQNSEDIYVSYLSSNNDWSEPLRLDFCKPDRNETPITVTANNLRVYVYDDATGLGDIYYSDFYDNTFHQLNLLDYPGVNTKYWETHCTVSRDGNQMYFVSNRPGGFGGRDIYVIKKSADGKWSTPENLGPTINTLYDEDSPFLGDNDRTLYFSNNGKQSMGGFDIFKSTLTEHNIWSAPVNMGYPVNSTNDDIYFTTSIDGTQSYFSSFRSKGAGEKDIYQLIPQIKKRETVKINGRVVNMIQDSLPLNFPIMLNLICLNCDPPKTDVLIFPHLKDGTFTYNIIPCKSYSISYVNINDQVTMFNDTFKTSCQSEFQELIKNVILDMNTKTIQPVFTPEPIKDSELLVFKELNFMYLFSYNLNELSVENEELKLFLKQIDEQMKKGKKYLTIEINSSVSRVPTRTYKSNKELAILRAKNMEHLLVNYLQNNTTYSEKVNVKIISSKINGLKYMGDFQNIDRYKEFQYVALNTN